MADTDRKYTINHSKIHGRGLFATQDLPVGTVLGYEQDIWPLTEHQLRDDQFLLSSFRSKRQQDQDFILNLSGGTGFTQGKKYMRTASKKDAAEHLRRIYSHNSQANCQGNYSLYKEIVHVNHSCYHNVDVVSDEAGRGALVVLTEVEEGDELLLNYAPQFFTSGQRADFLSKTYNIGKCGCKVCTLCTLLAKKRKQSDSNRRQLQTDMKKLEKWEDADGAQQHFSAAETLRVAEGMLPLTKKEGIIGAEVVQVYEVAYEAAKMAREWGKAKEYGTKLLLFGEQLRIIGNAQMDSLHEAVRTLPDEQSSVQPLLGLIKHEDGSVSLPDGRTQGLATERDMAALKVAEETVAMMKTMAKMTVEEG